MWVAIRTENENSPRSSGFGSPNYGAEISPVTLLTRPRAGGSSVPLSDSILEPIPAEVPRRFLVVQRLVSGLDRVDVRAECPACRIFGADVRASAQKGLDGTDGSRKTDSIGELCSTARARCRTPSMMYRPVRERPWGVWSERMARNRESRASVMSGYLFSCIASVRHLEPLPLWI